MGKSPLGSDTAANPEGPGGGCGGGGWEGVPGRGKSMCKGLGAGSASFYR